METLIVALVLAATIYAFYVHGKRTGSHGGFVAGRRRGRREAFHRRRRKMASPREQQADKDRA